MQNKKFAKLLKEKREAAGYNQSQASEKLFISRSTYNHYECGTRIPSLELAVKIAVLYQINPLELLFAIIPPEIKQKNLTYLMYLCNGKYSLTNEELEFISNFNSLTLIQQKEILKLIRIILDASDS